MKKLMNGGTKCLLVYPKFSVFSFWNYGEVGRLMGAKHPGPPLGLMTVAALLPQEWEFKLVDANVEPILNEHFKWADIVCTGGMLPQQQGTLDIIGEAHKHGKPVVVGGPDATSQPDLYRTADYLVLGEGEITIPLFLQDLEKDSRSGTYQSSERPDLTETAIPRFDLVRFKNYMHIGIQYSRGCCFKCEFCDIIELYGRIPRTKGPEQIIKELQALYDLGYRGHVDFVDDNFIGNTKKVKKVLQAVKEWSIKHKYPFYFSTEASINLADDEELLQLMKDVDFKFVFVGIESPDDKILELIKKRQNVNKPITETIKKLYSYGMIVNAGFILGFDDENNQTAEYMVNCIQESGICMAMVGFLYAFPNTQLKKRLRTEGRLFENASIIRDHNTQIDQLSAGLNFITSRPRVDIFSDLVKILKNIYDPRLYYERVLYTCLNLKPSNNFRPAFKEIWKKGKAFFRLCLKEGFKKQTAWLFWKTFFTILIKNPRVLEPAFTLAAMYRHFYKTSEFVIDLTNKKIRDIEKFGEQKFNEASLGKGSLAEG